MTLGDRMNDFAFEIISEPEEEEIEVDEEEETEE